MYMHGLLQILTSTSSSSCRIVMGSTVWHSHGVCSVVYHQVSLLITAAISLLIIYRRVIGSRSSTGASLQRAT